MTDYAKPWWERDLEPEDKYRLVDAHDFDEEQWGPADDDRIVTLFCKTCGTDKLQIGRSWPHYETYAKCPSCGWVGEVHSG